MLLGELPGAFSLYGLHKLSKLRIHAGKIRGNLIQVFASENIHNALELCIRITLRSLHWCEAVVLRVVREQAAGHLRSFLSLLQVEIEGFQVPAL